MIPQSRGRDVSNWTIPCDVPGHERVVVAAGDTVFIPLGVRRCVGEPYCSRCGCTLHSPDRKTFCTRCFKVPFDDDPMVDGRCRDCQWNRPYEPAPSERGPRKREQRAPEARPYGKGI
jgi:hypothetical protein